MDNVPEKIPVPQKPLYVFELPVRLWHWSMALSIAVLIPTGYIVGKPWHSLDGDPTFLFYLGYTRLAHYIAGFVLMVGFLWRIAHAFLGNKYSREIFLVPVWKKEWWQDLLSDIRWYLFLDKSPRVHMGHNPLAQVGMSSCVALLLLMIFTGGGMLVQASDPLLLKPFWLVVDFIYWIGGNGQDLHSWHRLGMLLLMSFVVIHLYMAIREEIMGKTSLVTTMFNGFRFLRSGRGG